MTDHQIAELSQYVREIGELKAQLASRNASFEAAVGGIEFRDKQIAALREIASELAGKCVRGKGACTACGAAGYMGSFAHNDGCAVSRLAALGD